MQELTLKKRSDSAFMFIENEIRSDFCSRRKEPYYRSHPEIPRSELLKDAINDACNCFANTYEQYMTLWDIFTCVYKHDLA